MGTASMGPGASSSRMKGTARPTGAMASSEVASISNVEPDLWAAENKLTEGTTETPVAKTPSDDSQPKAFEPPAVSDAAIEKFNSEIRRIDKIISVWGEARHIRFDNSHHVPDEESELPEESVEPTEVATARPALQAEQVVEDEPSPVSQSNMFAICLTFGGLLAIVLGAAHAIALSGPRLTHDVRIAAGFVCCGALGVIFGLWFEVGQLRRKVKSLMKE